MNDVVNVKQADQNDIRLLIAICRKSYVENYADHWNEGGLDLYLDKVYGSDSIQRDLTNPDILYFIAEIKGDAIGFMKLNLNSNVPDYPSSEGMEIEKLYFLIQYQGKGIGKKLSSIAFALARNLNKKTIWLAVIDTNENAIQFYKKVGFKIYNRTSLDAPYFKDELRGMWRMTCDIPKTD